MTTGLLRRLRRRSVPPVGLCLLQAWPRVSAVQEKQPLRWPVVIIEVKVCVGSAVATLGPPVPASVVRGSGRRRPARIASGETEQPVQRRGGTGNWDLLVEES